MACCGVGLYHCQNVYHWNIKGCCAHDDDTTDYCMCASILKVIQVSSQVAIIIFIHWFKPYQLVFSVVVIKFFWTAQVFFAIILQLGQPFFGKTNNKTLPLNLKQLSWSLFTHVVMLLCSSVAHTHTGMHSGFALCAEYYSSRLEVPE